MQHSTDIRLWLDRLIQTCKDGQEGFLTAAENIDDEEIRRLFSEYSLQRAKFVGELQAVAHELGNSDPENASSVPGTLHRGWINLKTAIVGREVRSILVECERGESFAVSEYGEALALEFPEYIRQIVERHHTAIVEAHRKVGKLADYEAPKWV
jgi:uncharacterized protein (TIGR02284 family)